jgi:hypothetical protein
MTTQSANINLLKFLILLHTFGQSASVKIDVNKLLQKYKKDCRFKQNFCSVHSLDFSFDFGGISNSHVKAFFALK